jgi:hypothetical protein
MLRLEREGWRVNGWMLGTIAENADTIAEGTPEAQAGEEQAAVVLLEFLSARIGGYVPGMREHATDRMQQTQPDYFVPETKLASVNIVDLRLEGDSYRAYVEETWEWGLEVHTYLMVPNGSGWLVDEYQ